MIDKIITICYRPAPLLLILFCTFCTTSCLQPRPKKQPPSPLPRGETAAISFVYVGYSNATPAMVTNCGAGFSVGDSMEFYSAQVFGSTNGLLYLEQSDDLTKTNNWLTITALVYTGQLTCLPTYDNNEDHLFYRWRFAPQ